MFRVVAGPFYGAEQFALARQHDDVTTAVAAMGEGMVLADDGRLVAFHERHLSTLQRLAR